VCSSDLSTQSQPFLSDIQEIRRKAHEDIMQGAVTPGQESGAEKSVEVLNRVLASELVCVLRYQRHYYMAQGIHAEVVKKEFLEHWHDEQEHVDRVAERIIQLNGEPDFDPKELLSRAVSEYKGGDSLIPMIEEDLVAERIVIMWYGELIRFFGESDPTTRRIMEDLLAEEEEHAEDLASLLINMGRDSSSGTNSGSARSGDRSSDAL